MIEHVSVPVTNYDAAKKFYVETLAPLGYTLVQDHPEWKAGGFLEGGHTSFWVAEKENMKPIHVALLAQSKEAVHKFYEAALAAGATDNGAPGFRTNYSPDYYAAFVHDPDGNNIEACYFGETAPEK
jgi:catechol 2,3-dioxygenase-like lactoylglutathione lyase family enzyme